MNKTRRQWIENIIAHLEDQKAELELASADEQEAYDNLPESIQYSERGEAMEDNVSELDDAASALEDIIETLMEIIER